MVFYNLSFKALRQTIVTILGKFIDGGTSKDNYHTYMPVRVTKEMQCLLDIQIIFLYIYIS